MLICRSSTALVALVLLATTTAGMREAQAAIVCQRKSRVTLRPGPRCMRKEQLVADLGALATARLLDTAGSALEARLGVLANEVGAVCASAPARRFVGSVPPTAPTPRLAGCRTLDDDPVACGAAFETGGRKARSCFPYAGRCLGCDDSYQGDVACTNACEPPDCKDATLKFVGSFDGCQHLTTQATCEAAFQLGGSTEDGALACYWDTSQSAQCFACDAYQQHMGHCTNACAVPLVQCRAPLAWVPNCFALSQQACGQSWQERDDDEGHRYPTSCYWGGPFGCTSCTLDSEFFPQCENRC
jgi:hypothetical protein